MTYPSVDKLQQTLAATVFAYATDKKKAAGRALGTLVEIITYYTLRAWGFHDHLVIEYRLSEFGNPDITHNVEFSMHPLLQQERQLISPVHLPLTTTKLQKQFACLAEIGPHQLRRSNQLLTSRQTRRNSCLIAENETGFYVGNVDSYDGNTAEVTISHLHPQPFAMFECKRVGVEEGMKKGPQTIEKAKQGAYVARSVSSLQKIRSRDGRPTGYLERRDGTILAGDLESITQQVISADEADLLAKFILTIGVVSNHGNWFTSENHNKELKVLAQSYDWLLFLTDSGLAQFIDKLLLHPMPELEAARHAFLASYGSPKSGANRFTKVQIDHAADLSLQHYFASHQDEIASWYNVIAPATGSIATLRDQLETLCAKNWSQIHTL